MSSQNDKDGSVIVRAAIITGIFALLAACVGGLFLLLNTMVNNGVIVFGASNPNNQNSLPTESPTLPPTIEPTATQILVATNTSLSVAAPASTCSELPRHLGAGKGVLVTLQMGCHYHFNVACSGCATDVENNYIIYYAGDSGDTLSVTVPERSIWLYNREPNTGEVCEAQDFYPMELPPFLNVNGVQLLRICT